MLNGLENEGDRDIVDIIPDTQEVVEERGRIKEEIGKQPEVLKTFIPLSKVVLMRLEGGIEPAVLKASVPIPKKKKVERDKEDAKGKSG